MENGASEQSFLLFYIGDTLYMVAVESIAAVSALPELTIQVPRSPPYMCGVCSFKGENCTIIDLNRLLEKDYTGERSNAAYRSIVVLEHRIALLVEKIVGVETSEDFLPLQKNLLSGGSLIRNVYRPSSKMWDFKRLKNEDELVFELDVFQLENRCRISQVDNIDIQEAADVGL